MKLKSNEIIAVIDNLVGPVEAVGESHIDRKILENLRTLIDITNWCLEQTKITSESCGRPEGSMHEIGWTAKCAMDEWKKWLGNVLDDDY